MRNRHAPYLQDYECGINLITSLHVLANMLPYDNLPEEHKSCVECRSGRET